MILYDVMNVHGTYPSEIWTGHAESNGPVEGSSENHAFVSEQENKDITFSFALDSRTVLLNNSANTHIYNDAEYYVDGIYLVPTSNSCTTIGGGLSPEEMGTVEWSWLDNLWATHTRQFPNTLFYPKYPVNILTVTVYVRHIKDTFGTHINSYACKSKLTWNF